MKLVVIDDTSFLPKYENKTDKTIEFANLNEYITNAESKNITEILMDLSSYTLEKAVNMKLLSNIKKAYPDAVIKFEIRDINDKDSVARKFAKLCKTTGYSSVTSSDNVWVLTINKNAWNSVNLNNNVEAANHTEDSKKQQFLELLSKKKNQKDEVSKVDPNSLVNDEDLKADICSENQKPTQKKKACKDCSCGLKEELETGEGNKEIKQSSCGNCYLGDAFRCSGCPYKGLPAFLPGEKIVSPGYGNWFT